MILVNVNCIWKNTDSSIGPFADDCLIYRNVKKKNDVEKLEKDLDTLGGVGGRKWN